MTTLSRPGSAEAPLPASILSQGSNLIVSIHTALDDEQLTRLTRDLMEQVGRQRSRGIIIEVGAVDVLDSFAARTLGDLARMAKLRGADTVVVGIAPEVAMAMVHMAIRIRRDYVPAFLRYLARQDEAYLDVVDTARDHDEARRLARAASAFLLELVAAFEMAQRGFMEVGLRRTTPREGPVEPPAQ